VKWIEKSKDAKSPGFTQIWNSFLDDPSISGKAKLLGILYARYASKDGEAWPGLKRLTELTGWKRYSLQKARSELRKKGFLTKRPRQDETGQFKGVTFRASEKIRVLRKTENRADGFSAERSNGPPDSRAAIRITSHSHSQLGEITNGEKHGSRSS
jgi:hypothetical protein